MAATSVRRWPRSMRLDFRLEIQAALQVVQPAVVRRAELLVLAQVVA